MPRSVFAIPRATDANNDPVSGALLYAFAGGTTAPVETYSDHFMTTPNTAPVVADAGGVFPPIYLPPGEYKFRITTPEGALIYEADWVPVLDASSTAGSVTPEDYGASVDALDNTAALQSWLDAIAAGAVGVGKGDYKFASPLTLGPANGMDIDCNGVVLRYVGASTSVNLLTIGSGAADTRELEVRGLTVTSDTTMTGGWAVIAERVMRSNFAPDFIIDGQDGTGKLFNGIWLKNCGDFFWSGVNAQGRGVGEGIRLTGQAPFGRAEYRFDNGRVIGFGIGLHAAGGVGGVYADLDYSLNAKHFRLSRDVVNETNREFFFGHKAIFDETPAGGVGVEIADTASPENCYLNFDGTWFASADAANIHILDGVQARVVINGGKIFNAGQVQGGSGHGILCESALCRLEMDGVLVEDNTGTGINLTKANPYYISRGGRFSGNGTDYSAFGRPENFYVDGGVVQFIETTQAIGTNTRSEVSSFGGSNGGQFMARFARGTFDARVLPLQGDIAGTFGAEVWDGNSWELGAWLRPIADQDVADERPNLRWQMGLINAAGIATSLMDARANEITFNKDVVIDGDLTITGSATLGTARFPSIEDFGGFTQATVTAMATVHGYIRVNSLIAVDENVTVSAPIHFEPGASLNVSAGNTVTIRNAINSPAQHIFRGAGTILLDDDRARMVKPEWWGDNTGADYGPVFQKMFSAAADGTELLVEPQSDIYYVATPVTTERAARVAGTGQRRFHVRALNALDGQDVFTTGEQGCIFQDMQFSAESIRTGGAYIRFNHPFCEARRVWYTEAFVGVDVRSNACTVEDITAFNNSNGAGSAVVALRDGTYRSRVRQVYFDDATSSERPESLVRCEGTNLADVSDVFGLPGVYGVGFYTAGGSCTGVTVRGVKVLSGCAVGGNVAANSLTGLTVSEVYAQAGAVDAVNFTASGGSIADLNIDDVQAEAISGHGLRLVRSSGSFDDVRLGSQINVSRAATPTLFTSITNLITSPAVLGGSAPFCRTVSVADDSVFVVSHLGNTFAAVLQVVTNAGAFGTWRARAASSPALTAMATINGITATTGVLTGTTGADGALTVSVSDAGGFYFENRSGAAVTVTMIVMGQ